MAEIIKVVSEMNPFTLAMTVAILAIILAIIVVTKRP